MLLTCARACKGGEAFYKGDDPSHPIRLPDLVYHSRYFFRFLFQDEDAAAGFFQQGFDRLGLRELQKRITPEIFRKMDHGRMDGRSLVLRKINIVISPVMRQIGTYQDDIPCLEPLDMISHELRAATFVEMDQLHFGVIVPSVVYERVPVFADAKGMRGCFWDLE